MHSTAPRVAVLVLAAVLAAPLAAAACNVCSGVTPMPGGVAEAALDGSGDYAGCVCLFVFQYSDGATPGKVRLVAPAAAAARVTVWDNPAAAAPPVAEFDEALDGATVWSQTGTLVVRLETAATGATAPGPVVFSVEAVNQAPLVVERDGLHPNGFFVYYPFGVPSSLPVAVSDPDNNGGGLTARLELTLEVPTRDQLFAMVVPAADDVTFVQGTPDTPEDVVEISGSASAVIAALEAAFLVATRMTRQGGDLFRLTVADNGIPGLSDTAAVSTYSQTIGPYPVGDIHFDRSVDQVTSGENLVPPTSAVYFLHDVHRLSFFEFDLDCSFETWIRVFDGPSVETGRLLSTQQSLDGFLCLETNADLPVFEGRTGELTIEYVEGGFHDSNGFNAFVSHTPVEFQVWFRVGEVELQAVVGGDAIAVPEVMVTSLPDASEVVVNVTADHGTVTLADADSFRDILAEHEGGLRLEYASPGAPVMLRVGDALAEVLYWPPADHSGRDRIRIEAASGGRAAIALEATVELGAVSVNAPAAVSTNAFRPTRIAVSVEATGPVTVRTSAGIGQVSVDPRAANWVTVGYATELVVERAEQLEHLVYFADAGGGADTVTLSAGGQERTIAVTVDPDCSGDHTIYAREGTVTERAGPPTEAAGEDTLCTFTIIGARELRFPYFELGPSSFSGAFFVVLAEDGTSIYFFFLTAPPTVLRAPTPHFFVEYNSITRTLPGFVGAFSPTAGLNDPPVIVVPKERLRVSVGSTTRLEQLYINDFGDGAVSFELTTDAGFLGADGVRSVSGSGATFGELDALVTGIDFLAGDVQTMATLTLRATDEGGAEDVAEFTIDILACTGIVAVELAGEDQDAVAMVTDGSGRSNYDAGLDCGWRLTGARAPAQLEAVFVDLECDGDTVVVYDGSSAAGRLLGEFCQADEIDGSLIASSGSFFVQLRSNGAGEQDGFSFKYSAVASGSQLPLAAAPDGARTEAAVVGAGDGSLVVAGGHNGVRAVASVLRWDPQSGWSAIGELEQALEAPAAAVLADGGVLAVHGGRDLDGVVRAETRIGTLQPIGTIAWTAGPASGPAGTAGDLALLVSLGELVLVSARELWRAGPTDWELGGAVPVAVIASSAAQTRDAAYFVGADAAHPVWRLDLTTVTDWTDLGVALGDAVSGLVTTGAMLGQGEYVVGGQRVNVTSGARDAFETGPGHLVGTSFAGQPALLSFEDGGLDVLVTAIEVAAAAPRVAPVSGATVVRLRGERFGTCGAAMCRFGDAGGTVEAAVVSERAVDCTVPAATGAAGVPMAIALVCEDGLELEAREALYQFEDPEIAALDPERPAPGDLVRVTFGNVGGEVLAAAAASSSPLCRFGEEVVSAEVVGDVLECRLPKTVKGGTVELAVSLDGQQFSPSARRVEMAQGGGDGVSIVIIVPIAIVAALAAMVALMGVIKYRRLASASEKWEIPFEALELGKEIASGGFGSVFRGQYRGGEVAVKTIKGKASVEAIDAFRKESALMAELRHPNIVLFMGACTEPPNIAIVLEFLPNGSLFDLLHDESRILRSSEQRSYALDIVKGMEYLHAAQPPIIHRDLKSLNVLVDKSWTMKVSDFGLTESFQDQDDHSGPVQPQGSLLWAAPEVLRGDAATLASDVYSFGITLWEICTRELPYEGVPPAAIAPQVTSTPTFRPNSDRLREPLGPIVQQCWADNPVDRPTFREVRSQLEVVIQEVEDTSVFTEMSPPWSVDGDTQSAVVSVRVDAAAAMWELQPEEMEQGIGSLHADIEQLSLDLAGHAVVDDVNALVVFEAPGPAIGFAGQLQTRLAAPKYRFAVAVGVAAGEVGRMPRMRTAMLQHTGAAVDSAQRLAWRANGGQTLVERRVVELTNVEVASCTAFDVDPSTVAVYPNALADRHDAGDRDRNGDRVRVEEEERNSWLIDESEVEIGDLIGGGSFGTVFKGTWRGAPVVCKKLHRRAFSGNERLAMQFELGLATRLRHPNICQVFGVAQKDDHLVVVSEQASRGSVFDAIVMAGKRKVPVSAKLQVARGIALGLQYLHSHRPPVVHRSVSGHNVLLGKDWTAKLSDFGMARTKDGAATMTRLASSAYTAPEIMLGERYDETADVYAFAVVLWEIRAQKAALSGMRPGLLIKAVLDGHRPDVAAKTGDDTDRLVDVMVACWKPEAADRPTMTRCIEMLEG